MPHLLARICHETSRSLGHELWFALTDRYCGKILFVSSGQRLSLEYHERKDESSCVMSGASS